MNLGILFGLLLPATAFASVTSGSPGLLITCRGNIGAQTINRPLTFGGSNPAVQEFATAGNVTYAIQLGSYLGFIDILLVQTTKDDKGNVISSGYVRTHGGTALDVVDPTKHINLTCDMTGL